ncbi:glutamine--fructose-6-phosphate transaminase (isomerizing) [Lentimicrobium sp.]|jgi:glucosamine--fructose-6-phosphate aminotransferase (isomerizing)|uniref:glutamine--fructose-6-phosphate transaminase (isomerizing) n=1 Tax=Lentimicrobium sp. TaxID=2034841 RepID=UPI0025DAF784|nr:glutamine--fructose-6-phosphate transaminase (isomerizing) [Lentimicrobium sp.]MCO5257481.1 glutamine--fructose-6-phosphate transaminase (isomerizing) [Lentimicrobium sp.]MCO5262929.1 glutamine--fructose-6-phosphate transaminase (isomerizing) [Lentimicrobium sp.]HOP13543.1 glutamine--fructose-6-phosphate transaminase (isomerizing) [Lentimicrobium sp.]HPF65364.1 glutamine--fructose-6-phosphate transaminase (isomerizing) [Lentimicrobium sp.]HPJ63003.1 glutamine--fructose-6-phosphate transamin
MCGIVAYIGPRQAYPILIKGLHRLEYRGYDSAGVAVLNSDLKLYKCKGKVAALEEAVKDKDLSGNIGIAHTRWATHGEPNDVNAHPHFSYSKNLAIIHNGIIENYAPLKNELVNRGFRFESETDTEVLIHLIEDIEINEKVSLAEAVQIALNQVVGAYAIVIIDKNDPDTLIAARKGSPLVVGIGENEFFVASDATPIVEYTREVVYLNDEEIAILHRNKEIKIKTITNIEKTPYIQTLEINLSALEKEGFDHFMLKEIYEQPRSIRDSMRGRLKAREGIVLLGGIIDYQQKLVNAKRIIIIACGTSWHAGLVGEYLFEELARIPVEVEYASEFRYRNPVIYEDDVVIAISQSGETADTLAAIELAKSKGATIIGVCNVVGSSIARATHAGSYTHAGPEIGVASTKAFTAQVTLLTLMALMLADSKGTISKSRFNQLLHELDDIPGKVEETLKVNDKIIEIARVFKDVRNALYLGRGYNFPVAMEGALKLKEISYIHAEGYPAAEMKHGPIALIDEEMPVVVVATNKGTYEKVVSNIQEVKARKGKIIAIVTEGDETVKALADHIIEVPETEEMLVPLIATIPLQLLSYHIALMRGCNVDQPRNLAKSVTVE